MVETLACKVIEVQLELHQANGERIGLSATKRAGLLLDLKDRDFSTSNFGTRHPNSTRIFCLIIAFL